MIKKLRNQPFAPKVGASSPVGARGNKKNITLRDQIRKLPVPFA
jgi:hypothetical protein